MPRRVATKGFGYDRPPFTSLPGQGHPGFGGGAPHFPGQGAGNQRPTLPFGQGQQTGGRTNFPNFGRPLPGNTGNGRTNFPNFGRPFPGNTGNGNTGNGNFGHFPNVTNGNRGTTSATTTSNSFRGTGNAMSGFQPGVINKIFGGQSPAAGPSIQSGMLVGPYGNINLVGTWWEPVSPFSLTSLSQQSPIYASSLGLTNPFLSSGFNSLNYLGNNPFTLGNYGLLGLSNPFLNTPLFGLSNPLLNNGLLGLNNPFLGNGLLGLNNPFLGSGFTGLNNPFLSGGFNSSNYWGNSWPLGSNPLYQGNVWNSPFTNPFANPLGYSPFGNPWTNTVLPTGGVNPLAPAVNNPFNGFRLF